MDTTERRTLISGQFEPEDAKDILTNIFTAKIQFHEMKNFSSQVRFGKMDNIAMKRIPELKESLDKSLDLINKAKQKSRQLVIKAEIRIEMAEADGDND